MCTTADRVSTGYQPAERSLRESGDDHRHDMLRIQRTETSHLSAECQKRLSGTGQEKETYEESDSCSAKEAAPICTAGSQVHRSVSG